MADKEKKAKKEPQTAGAPEVPEHLTEHLDKPEQTEEPKQEAAEDVSEKIGEDTKENEAAETPFDDKQTEEAIEDIEKTNSDALLEAEDEAKEAQTAPEPKRPWYKRAKFWKITVSVVVLIAATLFAVPTTRYWILNTAGVRVSASVLVQDDTTGQPLKNVTVMLGTLQTQTDAEGRATLSQLKLGPQTFTLERVAFEKQTRQVTLGLGSNPLGTFRLRATGAQYTFVVTDYLSGKPIATAEATSDTAAASSDEEGKVVLTIGDANADEATVTIAAPGYRSEPVVISLESTEPANVILVPSTKAVFVSRESGRYDVYTMDIDGKNKQVLLAGTGRENGNITLVPSPDSAQVALISTRDDVRAADGMLLSTLTLINIADGSTITTDRGEQMQIIDWIGTKVVYHMTVAGQAASSDSRQRIISFDYKTNSRAQLASANQIRSAAVANGQLYFTDGVAYYRIGADGNNRQTVLDKPVWSSYRTAYDALTLQTQDGWYRVSLANGAAAEIAEPDTYPNRVYAVNASGAESAWVENSNLHIFKPSGSQDAVLHTQSGLNYPLRWLNNTDVVFRVVSGQEVADYVISTQGGQARRLTSVTATFGPSQTY